MLLHRAVETVRTNLGLDSAVWFRVLGGLFVLFIPGLQLTTFSQTFSFTALTERRPRSTGAALSSTCTGERGLCLHPTSATKRFLLFVSFLLSAVIWNFHHTRKKRKTDAAVNGPLRFRGKSCCCSSGFGSGLCWLLLYVGWPGWKL